MKQNILKLLIMLCLAVLLPAMALAAGGTWGGIDWNFEVTDPVTGMGTLTISPTTKSPDEIELDHRVDFTPGFVSDGSDERYEVGEWKEAVKYIKSDGTWVADDYEWPWPKETVNKLIIEEGVTSIGSFVAQNMPLQGELVIPSTVRYIGQEAFLRSTFSSVKFAEGENGSQLKCIAQGGFKYLKITSLELPAGLECVHAWAFQGCDKLESIKFNSDMKALSGQKHVDWEPGRNKDGAAVLAACPQLKEITFSDESDIAFMTNGHLSGGSAQKAYTGLTVYTDLQAAIDAAAAGNGTVTLVKDVDVTIGAGQTIVIPPNVTLNLNGRTLTNNGLLVNLGQITGRGTLTNNKDYSTNDQALVDTTADFKNNSTPLKAWGISYNLKGGEVAGANPTYYMEGNEAITLLNPTRNGYTFKGWSGTGLNGDKNQTVTIPANSTRNFTFTANWTPIKAVNTGDEAQLALWFGLCLAGCAGMVLLRKPRRQMK